MEALINLREYVDLCVHLCNQNICLKQFRLTRRDDEHVDPD